MVSLSDGSWSLFLITVSILMRWGELHMLALPGFTRLGMVVASFLFGQVAMGFDHRRTGTALVRHGGEHWTRRGLVVSFVGESK